MFKTLTLFCFRALVISVVATSSAGAAPEERVPVYVMHENECLALTDVQPLEADIDQTEICPTVPEPTIVLQGNASTTIEVTEEDNSPEAKATSLPLYEWVGKGTQPKAAIILVHGLFQHGESLAPFARHLASLGYLAISLDQRGHGFWHFKNALGEPGYAIDYKQSIDDVTRLARVLRQEHPSLPVFCLGESAGAAIAARSAAKYPGLYDGLILCAFATKPRALRLRWTIEDVANNMFDWDRDIQMTRYVKRFTSEDKRVTSETMNDPLCRRGISLKELVDTCKFMKKTGKVARQLSPSLPLLIVEGQDDQVLSPKSSAQFLEKTRCRFKRLVLIPHCGHVLVSTTFIKPLVLQSIDEWLTLHVPGRFSTGAVVAKR